MSCVPTELLEAGETQEKQCQRTPGEKVSPCSYGLACGKPLENFQADLLSVFLIVQ